MSKNNKVLAHIIAIIVLGCAALLYFEGSMKGFPDGHLTELDRAEKPLFFILCFILIVSGFFLLYLARFAKWRNSKIIFYRTILFLSVVILLAASLNGYFISTLEYGGGG